MDKNTFNSSYNSLDISGTKLWEPTPRKGVKRQFEPMTTKKLNISNISSSSSSPRGRMRSQISLSPINNVTSSIVQSTPRIVSIEPFVYDNPVRPSLRRSTLSSPNSNKKIHSLTEDRSTPLYSPPRIETIRYHSGNNFLSSHEDFTYDNPVRPSLIPSTPPSPITVSPPNSNKKIHSSTEKPLSYNKSVQSTPQYSPLGIETRRYHSGNNYLSSPGEDFIYDNPVRPSLIPSTPPSPITVSPPNSNLDLGFLSKKNKNKNKSSKKKKKSSSKKKKSSSKKKKKRSMNRKY